MTRKEQLDLSPDLAAPDEHPDVRERLHAELDLADTLRGLRTQFKAAQDATTAKMVELGITRHPYVDSRSGNKRFRLADTTAKAKTIAAAGSPAKRKSKRRREADEKDPDVADPTVDRVESRRVSRESVEREIGPLDPFANTRGLMDKADAPATEH